MLAYLHPNHYRADPDRLSSHGLDLSRKRVVLRFVDRGALHDLGTTGFGEEAKRSLVAALAQQAEVVVSSEAELPPDLESYRSRIPIEAMHDPLQHSALLVGESATMCAEAAVLGTPAILIDSQSRGYADDLTDHYGTCFRFPVETTDAAIAKASEILAHEDPRLVLALAHRRLLRDHIDASAYQVEQMFVRREVSRRSPDLSRLPVSERETRLGGPLLPLSMRALGAGLVAASPRNTF